MTSPFYTQGMDLAALLPRPLRTDPQAVTRHLYFWDKPGHVTCLFQRHPRVARAGLRLKAIPAEVERDPDTARRMSKSMYALSYVLEGGGRLRYLREGKTFDLRPGTLFQFNGHRLADVVIEARPGLLECSACVDGDTGAHLGAVTLWRHGFLVEQVGLRPSVVQEYMKLFEAIGDPASTPRSLLRRFIELIELFDRLADRDDPNRSFRIEAQALLGGNVSPSYRIDEAARAMDMTYEGFRQRFLKTFGMSPTEFQLRRRMERATVLLRGHSVKETAGALGYGDPFVFSRQFRQRMGVSPKNYRQSLDR